MSARRLVWLGLAGIVGAVSLLGFVVNLQVVRSLEREFLRHGAEHATEIAESLLPLLRVPLAAGEAPDAVARRFQQLIHHPHSNESFAVALFDLDAGQVVAVSMGGVQLRVRRVYALLDAAREARGRSPAPDWQVVPDAPGRPDTLVHFSAVDQRVPGWVLAVQTDVAELTEPMHVLHWRLTALLVLATALVALWAGLTMRFLGRSYERHLEAQLAVRTEELAAAHAQGLEQARLVTLGQTASMLAHEIRNPLAAIKLGLSGLLSAGYLQPRERRRVDIALAEVDRLNGMLTEALNYVRPVQISDQPVALDGIVDRVLALLEPTLQQAGIRVRRRRCGACHGTRLDPGQIEQVVLNLIKNAVEASPEGASLEISVGCESGRLGFEIANPGALSAEAQARAFEPFYTTKPTGSGLGLLLVSRVVRDHGGEVAVESSSGWTRFRFYLPGCVDGGGQQLEGKAWHAS